MLKPWHKEQQQECHNMFSEKYFEGMNKGDGNWGHHHLLPVLGSLSTFIMKNLSADMPNLYPPPSPCCCRVRPASFCSPHLNMVPYPLAKSGSQHPCLRCHFCAVTCWLLMSKPDIKRQSKHISRKPVSQTYWAAKKRK